MLHAQHLGMPDPSDALGAFIMCPSQHHQRAQQHAHQVLKKSHISPRPAYLSILSTHWLS